MASQVHSKVCPRGAGVGVGTMTDLTDIDGTGGAKEGEGGNEPLVLVLEKLMLSWLSVVLSPELLFTSSPSNSRFSMTGPLSTAGNV